MIKHIVETLETPVMDPVDVIVAGGGFAGVAAALAARRLGASVLLLEKTALLGGLGTNGLISWYEPLCDGLGEQMITGLAEELLRLSIRYGDNTLPQIWRDRSKPVDKSLVRPEKQHPVGGRYGTFFSPPMCQMAMDEILKQEGVQIRLDITAARPVMENGHVTGVVCESVSGRQCFPATAFVDATGDADLFYRAGCPTVNGSNFLSVVAHFASLTEKKKPLEQRRWFFCGADLHGGGHPEGYPYLSGTTNEEVTRFLLDGRKMLLDQMKANKQGAGEIATLPSQAQFRKTRRINGRKTLTEADLKVRHEDSIALTSDFERVGDWYEIPYGCLIADGADNLFAAGRMISSEGWAWDVTRVIPDCALTGEVAGTAAAMAALEHLTTETLPLTALQAQLQKQGVRLHRD